GAGIFLPFPASRLPSLLLRRDETRRAEASASRTKTLRLQRPHFAGSEFPAESCRYSEGQPLPFAASLRRQWANRRPPVVSEETRSDGTCRHVCGRDLLRGDREGYRQYRRCWKEARVPRATLVWYRSVRQVCPRGLPPVPRRSCGYSDCRCRRRRRLHREPLSHHRGR